MEGRGQNPTGKDQASLTTPMEHNYTVGEGRKRTREDKDEREEHPSSDVGGGKRDGGYDGESDNEDNNNNNNSTSQSHTTEDDGDWSEELHQMFASAIYEVGLRNSSPAVILENMSQKPGSITSERVKSKLQKYRNNKDKSKQEFMEEYVSFLHRAHAIEGAGGIAGATAASHAMGAVVGGGNGALLEMMGSTKLLGGDAAAYLSYAVLKEDGLRQAAGAGGGVGGGEGGPVLSTQFLRKGALEYVENFAGAGIPFPVLTTEEKSSSLGVSMTFVMGLFLSMTQHLASERSKVAAANAQPNFPFNGGAEPAVASEGAEAFHNSFETMQDIEASKRQSKVSFSLDNNGGGSSYPPYPNQYPPGQFSDNNHDNGLTPVSGIVKTGEATRERALTSPSIEMSTETEKELGLA